jgi:hypothetical protein
MDQFEQRVDHAAQDEQKKQGTNGAGAERHVGAAQVEDAVGVSGSDDKGE